MSSVKPLYSRLYGDWTEDRLRAANATEKKHVGGILNKYKFSVGFPGLHGEGVVIPGERVVVSSTYIYFYYKF